MAIFFFCVGGYICVYGTNTVHDMAMRIFFLPILDLLERC
jgi:hypothetical protein